MPVVATLPADNNDVADATIDDELILIHCSSRTVQSSQRGQWTAGQSHADYMPWCIEWIHSRDNNQRITHHAYTHTHEQYSLR